MSNRKGGAFERELLDALRKLGVEAERLRLAGTKDEGDLVVKNGITTVIEAKNEARIDLPGYLRELDAEVLNYTKARGLDPDAVDGVVVVKRRGKGASQAYVVTTVEKYFT